jgi:hypothetical protein
MSGTFIGGGVSVWASDSELAALDLDPWTEQGWAGEDLAAFKTKLLSRCQCARAALEIAVLARYRRDAMEQWLVPIVEQELAGNPSYIVSLRVLPSVEAAMRAAAPLLFIMD